MIEIGKYNKLTALRITPPGMYLAEVGQEELAILLPHKFIPADLEVDQEIEVFVYKDHDERLIATTQIPKITLEQFGCLEVKDVNSKGAFLDWGLDKDLFAPFGEQKKPMQEGDYYLVYLYLDLETDRLVATSKIDTYLEKENITVAVGDKVDLLIGDSTDIGVNVVINNTHRGLIYHNEIFKTVFPGERTIGYIKTIRDDKKIDVSLQQQGFINVDPSSDIIIEKLKANKGFLSLTDDSAPDEIMLRLQMSKKTFKKAIGVLYKQRLILIKDEGIYLVE